jgi:hypothetical protein
MARSADGVALPWFADWLLRVLAGILLNVVLNVSVQ